MLRGAAGLGELVGEYLGEWPALSAKKTSLRRARPDSPTEWHQDGAFLGDGIRTVNAWTALTPCGRDAPGVEVFARPFDEIVATGTDDALFNWSVSPEQAQRLGTGDVVKPRVRRGRRIAVQPADPAPHRRLTDDDPRALRDRIMVLRPVDLSARAGADRLLSAVA